MGFLDLKVIITGVLTALAIFAVGVIIGYYSKQGEFNRLVTLHETTLKKETEDRFANEQDLIAEVLQNVNADYIRNYHRQLTSEPHIAGKSRDEQITQYIKTAWTEMGMNNVELSTYEFYLSWPNQTNPNKIYLVNADGEIEYMSRHKEVEVHAGDDHPDFVHAFNAYAPASDITGELVYINYGRVEDLFEIERDFNISVEGKICIARYGKIFRGNKVRNCQDRGGIGIILFSDPNEVAPLGTEPDKVYPNSIFMPGTAVQRGSVYIGNGDPLTPEWSSVPHSYRKNPKDVDGLPKIPAQPIGYGDAAKFLEKMAGPLPPEAWKGKIANVEYRLGGEMIGGYRIRLVVNNYRKVVNSSNVIGFITGEVEPDRYVMIGNHRDAWGYGAVDPSSGTAIMMEVARSFGELLRQGWRPRRSIVICSWAAEEFGLEGSYEWVYENKVKLMQRTVAMLNIDAPVSGPIASCMASPVLKDVVLEATSHSSDPTSTSNRSYLDFWNEYTKSNKLPQPEAGLLGSGSDHAPFAFVAGIPAIYLNFKVDPVKYPGVSQYPAYHTGYETFYLMDKLIDPGFKIHRTSAQASLWILLNLADSTILPFSLNNFPALMKKSLNEITQDVSKSELLEANNVTLKYLFEAVDNFATSTQRLMAKLVNFKPNDPLEIRVINDQLMLLDRVFLMDKGIPLRPGTRNSIFAPQMFNKYGGSAFPAIYDLLHGIEELPEDQLANRWEEIKKHVSDLMIMVNSAAKFLLPVDRI